MTQRERLIELIDDFGDDVALCDVCDRPREDCAGCTNEQLAEYLLENGVVVLPCKVGDDVYCLAGSDGNKIEKDECIGYYIKPEQRNLITEVRVVSAKGNYGTYGVIGESFFLTREEAEKAIQALKGGVR